jgi:hypothetical protein
MRRWRPQASNNLLIAITLFLAAATSAAAIGSTIAGTFGGPPESWQINLPVYGRLVLTLMLTLAALALLYRVIAGATLVYDVDRNGVYIANFWQKVTIPLHEIRAIDQGIDGVNLPWGSAQALGHYWGTATSPDATVLHLFSSVPPGDSVIITTEQGAYAIAPGDLDAFVQDIEQRRKLGVTKRLSQSDVTFGWGLGGFVGDPHVQTLLTLAGVVCVLGLGLIAWAYPSLPSQIDMRFDATGETTGLLPRHSILYLPAVALAVAAVNLVLGLLVYRWERLASRVLQAATLIAQLLFALAVLAIIT